MRRRLLDGQVLPRWRRVTIVWIWMCFVCFANLAFAERGNHPLYNSETQSPWLGELPRKDGISLKAAMRSRGLGDFDDLNNLFDGTIIRLPDMYAEAGKVLGATVRVWISNIRCFGISVDDIVINYNFYGKRRFYFNVDVKDLNIDCEVKWRFKWSFIGGRGDAQAYTRGSDAETQIAFISRNFDIYPPHESKVNSCNSNVEIYDLDFQGGITGSILNTFERSFRGMVERQINSAACDELGSLGTTFIGDILEYIDDIIEGYLGTLPPDLADVLLPEKNLKLAPPSDTNLVDFSSTEETVGKWFHDGLLEIDKLLGTMTPDPDAPTGTGLDLGINRILRQTMLDENRAYIIPVADWPDYITSDGIIFQGHDMLTETTMQLIQMKVLGMDTFTKFDPLNDVGNYTVTNHLFWKNMFVEVDLKLTMKPSSTSDSIIITGSTAEVVENIKIQIGIDNVDVDFHFFLAIDQEKLGDIQIGSVMNSTRMFPCFLNSIYDAEISGLSASVANIREPDLSGFISSGIDQVVSKSSDAAFAMYEKTLLNAMPNFFQKSVRSMLNGFISTMIDSTAPDQCPTYDVSPDIGETIDFRDLILSPEMAYAYGARGDSPYGDLGYTMMDIIRNNLLAPNPLLPEYAMVNDVVISPMTLAQSGVEGVLDFETTFLDLSSEDLSDVSYDIINTIEFQVSDLMLSKLNTVRHPMEFLSVDAFNSKLLHNDATLEQANEVERRKLLDTDGVSASTTVLFSIDGDESLFKMSNEMNISFTMPQVIFVMDFEVYINTYRLLTFPIEDLINQHCWLSIFNSNTSDTADTALMLKYFFMNLSNMGVDFECLECSTTGLEYLPEIIGILEDAGSFSLLGDGVTDVISDIIDSGWIDEMLGSFISEAPMLCPHDPNYDESYELSESGNFFYPALSRGTVEFAIYSGTLLFQVATVVMAKSYEALSDSESSSDYYPVDDSIEFLDLTSMSEIFGSIWDLILDEMNAVVGKTHNIFVSRSTKNDIGINILIRSYILDGSRSYAFEFDDMKVSIDTIDFILDEIRLTGLDSFKSFDILNITGPQTIQNSLSLEQIGCEVDIGIDLNDGSTEMETMTIKLALSDVMVSIGLMVAIDSNIFSDMQMGSLMDTDTALSCFLVSLHSLKMTDLGINVGDIELPSIEGFLSSEMKDVIDQSFNATFSEYLPTIKESIPKIFDMGIKPVINTILDSVLEESECPTQNVGSGYVQLGDLLLSPESAITVGGNGTSPYGNVLSSTVEFINERPVESDSLLDLPINNIISRLTERQSGIPGSMKWEGEVLEKSIRLKVAELKANLQLKVSDVQADGIDSIGSSFHILKPTESYAIDNSVQIGTDSNALRSSATIFFSFEKDDVNITNHLKIGFDMDDVQVDVGTMMKIVEKALLEFPLKSVTNINCWLSTLEPPQLDSKGLRLDGSDTSLEMETISVILSKLQLHVECLSCSSPGFNIISESASTPLAIEELTGVMNDLFRYLAGNLGDEYLQVQIDRLLSEAPAKCPHHPSYSESNLNYQPFDPIKTKTPLYEILFILVGIFVTLVIAIGSIFAAIKRKRRKKHTLWLNTLTKNDINELHRQEKEKRMKEMRLNETTTSMMMAPTTPRAVRYLIPLTIFANIGFFLSGHLSLGATVNVDVTLAGQDVTLEKFFTFSMAQSILDMIEAGATELAVIIILFSGVWPYVKQLSSLCMFILPPSIVSVQRRESILLLLDSLGKWSFIDIFVLIVSVTSFRVIVNSPDDLSFLPSEFYSVNLMVVPLWGLYANLIAQLISQVSSHVIIHYHRKISLKREGDECEYEGGDSSRSDRLCDHQFALTELKTGRFLVIRKGINHMFIFISFTITVLVICGCCFKSFSLETLGLIGIAVEAGQNFQEALKNHSIFTTMKLLVDQATYLGGFWNYIGLGTLSIVLFTTVLIVPLTQIILMCRRWFMSLNQKQRFHSFVIFEALEAWKYLEVYILAVIIASWQLGSVSEFLINEYCGSFDDAFTTMAYHGFLKEEDAQCFRVDAEVKYGTWMLTAAAITLSLLAHFVGKAASHQEEDIHREKVDSVLPLSFREEAWDLPDGKILPKPPRFSDYYRWLLQKTYIPDEQEDIRRSTTVANECAVSVSSFQGPILPEYEHQMRPNTSPDLEIILENETLATNHDNNLSKDSIAHLMKYAHTPAFDKYLKDQHASGGPPSIASEGLLSYDNETASWGLRHSNDIGIPSVLSRYSKQKRGRQSSKHLLHQQMNRQQPHSSLSVASDDLISYDLDGFSVASSYRGLDALALDGISVASSWYIDVTNADVSCDASSIGFGTDQMPIHLRNRRKKRARLPFKKHLRKRMIKSQNFESDTSLDSSALISYDNVNDLDALISKSISQASPWYMDVSVSSDDLVSYDGDEVSMSSNTISSISPRYIKRSKVLPPMIKNSSSSHLNDDIKSQYDDIEAQYDESSRSPSPSLATKDMISYAKDLLTNLNRQGHAKVHNHDSKSTIESSDTSKLGGETLTSIHSDKTRKMTGKSSLLPYTKYNNSSSTSIATNDLVSYNGDDSSYGLSVESDAMSSINPRYIKRNKVRPPMMNPYSQYKPSSSSVSTKDMILYAKDLVTDFDDSIANSHKAFMQYSRGRPSYTKYPSSSLSLDSNDLMSYDGDTASSDLSIENGTLPSINPSHVKKKDRVPFMNKANRYAWNQGSESSIHQPTSPSSPMSTKDMLSYATGLLTDSNRVPDPNNRGLHSIKEASSAQEDSTKSEVSDDSSLASLNPDEILLSSRFSLANEDSFRSLQSFQSAETNPDEMLLSSRFSLANEDSFQSLKSFQSAETEKRKGRSSLMQYADSPSFKKYFKSTESIDSDDLISIDGETYASGLSISNDTLPSINPRYIKKRKVRPPRMKNNNTSGLDSDSDETKEREKDDFLYEYGFSVSSRNSPTLNALALESISRVVPSSYRSSTPNGTPASLYWDGLTDPDYLPPGLNSNIQHPLSHVKYGHGSTSQSIATDDMVSYHNGDDGFSITSRRGRGLKSFVELEGMSVASSRYIDLNTLGSDGISTSDTLSSGESMGNDTLLSGHSDETEKTKGGHSIMKYAHTPSFHKYFKSSSSVLSAISSDDISHDATSTTSSYQKRGLNSLGRDDLSVASSTRRYPFHRSLGSIASSGISLSETSTSTSLSSGGWSTESDDDNSTPTESSPPENDNGWSWPWGKKYLDEKK